MNEKFGTILVKNGKAAHIYVDAKGGDYDGLSLVANSFAKDINLVAGVTPTVTTDIFQLEKTVVIVGSIGNNDLIDSFIEERKLDVSAIKNKWECYKIQVLESPTEGIDKAIVVVGSDKRGTIYGVYHISELIGVSPWVYWGDVIPAKQEELVIHESKLNKTSKEPSVKYRGFFLNDDWPSLGTWTMNKFGDFNEELYGKVFELLLRLKGNYLWPAMWSAIFSENGKSSNIANAKLADAYGIVMGTSHHEGMFRAGEEWQKDYKQYGTSNEWNFANNKEAITKFWEDAVIRNKDYENLITLGMRGERDSSLGGSIHQNIELLKSIITTQKDLLHQYGVSDAPQVLTLYKEVEQFWYGTAEVEGLKHWEVLNNVTIMLSEDNFGNLRTLPTQEEREREAGWGMYYHFDYHGGPHSYEWVNTVPIEKTWEQMSMAYDYGVREVWIVNVGDLKPMEFPISYFLDLAYDFDTWGTQGINKTKEYTKQWVLQQFGSVAEKVSMDGIANVISDYTRMNGKRKPEIVTATTFSITNYNEAQTVLAEAITLENDAKSYYELMPENYKDAYYQLVFYPMVASVNVRKMQIYAGLNQRYCKLKSVLANRYAQLVEEAILIDQQMQSYYNDTMSNGKWQGIMSSAHIGYIHWDATGWQYPKVNNVTPLLGASMVVDMEGSEVGYTSGIAQLPTFTNLGKESYSITISNEGNAEFDFKVEATENWILVDTSQGVIKDGKSIKVAVDWEKVLTKSLGVITITGLNQTVKVNVIAEVVDVSHFSPNTFIGKNNVISIEAEHIAKRVAKSNVEWKVIEHYGRTLSSVKMFPTTVSFEKAEDAPYLEYSIYVDEDGEYLLTAYTAPTNNLIRGNRLCYGVSFDAEKPVIVASLQQDYVAGDYNNIIWCKGVMDNIHIMTSTHSLKKGIHILRFYGLDAGLVLQKLVLSKGALPMSYFGPKESYYKNK
jgi:hypothetical protein